MKIPGGIFGVLCFSFVAYLNLKKLVCRWTFFEHFWDEKVMLYKLFHSVLDQIISRWITAHYSIRRKTARTLLIKDYANSLTNSDAFILDLWQQTKH